MLAVVLVLLSPQSVAARPAALPAKGREKVVCKRFVETGSLVRTYKSCKSAWEWERERANIRAPKAIISTCAPGGTVGC